MEFLSSLKPFMFFGTIFLIWWGLRENMAKLGLGEQRNGAAMLFTFPVLMAVLLVSKFVMWMTGAL